jgi:hypothetical protein
MKEFLEDYLIYAVTLYHHLFLWVSLPPGQSIGDFSFLPH